MSLRPIALALAVFGTATSAFAQSTTTTTTTTRVERTGPIKLTPEQRTTVYRTVTRERRVAPPAAEVEVSVGRPVPSSVMLSPFPETVYVEQPALRSYRYFYVNNRVVLVDPATSEVVDILDQ